MRDHSPSAQPGFRPRGGSGATGGWRIPAPRGSVPAVPAVPQDATRPPAGLSHRDLILLRHLTQGGSTTQIAAALAVSRNTARTRIRRVEAKLGVPDRGRLALAARDLGLA